MHESKTLTELQPKALSSPALIQQPALPEKQSEPGLPWALQRATDGLPSPEGTSPIAHAARMLATPQPGGATYRAQALRALQGTIGNTRVGRLLGTAVQTKLTVNTPSDIYEEEADRVADQVMRMPEPRIQRQLEPEEEETLQTKPLMAQITPLVQRQVEPEEEEEPVQAKLTEDVQLQRQEEVVEEEKDPLSLASVLVRRQMNATTEPLQAQATPGETPEVTPGVESHISASRGGGEPLAGQVRAFAERRFGVDFGRVRVHTDARSNQVARALNAQAFTSGRDIYFSAGSYQPTTPDGKRLLAHELTHTVQQAGTVKTRLVRRQPAKPGIRETTVTVRWIDDDRKFYHRVINAIARSREFLGVEKASLWQPFYQPVFRLFGHLTRGALSLGGSSVKLRALAWFDPTVFHGQVTGASIESEQAARLRETEIKGVLTPREIFPDRGPTEVGPGAVVDLSFTSKSSVTAAFLGGLKWFKASGNGTVVGGNDGKGTFEAGPPGYAQLELRVVAGFSAGKVVSTHLITVLAIKDMVNRDPDKPERLTIARAGLTPELLAEYLYGDKSKATAIWAVWDEKARGEPWKVTTKIPVGMWIRFEYRYLKPELQKVYDASLDITSRAEWGAKPPILGDPKKSYEPYTGPLENILDSIVVHHAGNEGYKTMNEVQDLHMGEKERADIGYHFGISLSGEVFEGRPIDVKGAHVEGANTGRIGIVLLADLDPENRGMRFYQFDRSEDPLSAKMEAALLRLIHFLVGKYPKIKYLGGHQEFDKTRFCPGKKAMDKISSWRSGTGLLPPP
ncbi:MAG: peptidoglycan recognition protein family protein [Anaerolineae bacterium]|nr:peptidoglycan recognition protein family protein [Anaerolineae bacterium]